jgi:hypothetical protein
MDMSGLTLTAIVVVIVVAMWLLKQNRNIDEQATTDQSRSGSNEDGGRRNETATSEMDFREADARRIELKGQRDAGNISDEEFDNQLLQLMVQDADGRWWAKSRKTGQWHYKDGDTWVPDTPPDLH